MTPYPNTPLNPSLPIVLLAGPTAVGKTALSLDLAERLETEIVNADSMQVYRFMDIGTAKPSAQERARVRHHLLDVVNPDEPYDAAIFADQARAVIEALHAQGKIPLVVGGTGLYMKALTRGLCPGPPADPELRRELLKDMERHGVAWLHAELSRVDPACAARIHPNDRQRLLRALEVYRRTGVPLSHWQNTHGFRQSLYATIKIALFRDRKDLYGRIDRRVLQMVDQGLVEEVRRLLRMGYPCSLKPMQSLGYRHICQVLAAETTLEEAIRTMQRDTRRYAKRQITWFRGDSEFRWFHAEARQEIFDAVLSALQESERVYGVSKMG
ncbi:tRNA (adenosine(37)-N6)-dimethylallyltransferase MiaA [Desulfosoma caldarium]|uniref:tRNA dimethylallyltransferase n=1 Tax=Desulfosoma caldarium TaxID=610254 RepID=A0A3N1VN13_9BACT|nr:tRNA (adenosine(37)-N6)-dimethylallyltransferase MiaA [Desulfosoma caldarium]ROR01592.1 tRNA dimethylallyltransferase [Desulfosoma caldarium]